jgi:hypothetical protein
MLRRELLVGQDPLYIVNSLTDSFLGSIWNLVARFIPFARLQEMSATALSELFSHPRSSKITNYLIDQVLVRLLTCSLSLTVKWSE